MLAPHHSGLAGGIGNGNADWLWSLIHALIVKFRRARFDANPTTAPISKLNHAFMNSPCVRYGHTRILLQSGRVLDFFS